MIAKRLSSEDSECGVRIVPVAPHGDPANAGLLAETIPVDPPFYFVPTQSSNGGQSYLRWTLGFKGPIHEYESNDIPVHVINPPHLLQQPSIESRALFITTAAKFSSSDRQLAPERISRRTVVSCSRCPV